MIHRNKLINPTIKLIDSTLQIGLPFYKNTNVKSTIVQTMLKSGIKHIELGNINCKSTKTIMFNNKDMYYDSKILSASIHSKNDIHDVSYYGGNEIITDKFITDETLNTRCYINNTNLKDVIKRINYLHQKGIKLFSIIDQNNTLTGTYLTLLTQNLSHIHPIQIALAFNNNDIPSLYTSIELGFNTFHTCLNGLGNIYSTQRMIHFLDEYYLNHNITNKNLISNTGNWLHTQLN